MEKFDRWHRLLFLHELAPLGAGGEVTKNHEEPDSLISICESRLVLSQNFQYPHSLRIKTTGPNLAANSDCLV